MLSLIQIKKKIEDFFNGHAQINNMFWANEFDMSATSKYSWPVAVVDDSNYAINGNYINYNFKCILADLYAPDIPQHSTSICSDMLRIAEDFCTFLEYSEDWTFQPQVTFSKSVDELGERASGIKFTFTIQVVRDKAPCQTPTV